MKRNQRVPHNSYYLEKGWFGLRNRLPSEVNNTDNQRDEAEALFFRHSVWKDDLNQPTKLGIAHLRKALTNMHNAHITASIPKLIPEIRAKLDECKGNLSRLGQPRDTHETQLQCMMNLASEFSNLSSNALEGPYY